MDDDKQGSLSFKVTATFASARRLVQWQQHDGGAFHTNKYQHVHSTMVNRVSKSTLLPLGFPLLLLQRPLSYALVQSMCIRNEYTRQPNHVYRMIQQGVRPIRRRSAWTPAESGTAGQTNFGQHSTNIRARLRNQGCGFPDLGQLGDLRKL